MEHTQKAKLTEEWIEAAVTACRNSVASNNWREIVTIIAPYVQRRSDEPQFTEEQVLGAAIPIAGQAWANAIIDRLTDKPKTPEERYRVEPFRTGWCVHDLSRPIGTTPDVFILKETAEIFREGLIARAKKEAE